MSATTTRAPLLRDVLGEALRRLRHDQRRTLADVAATAALSLAYLSEIERGRKEASSEVLAALCEALGVSLADLLAMVSDAMVPAVPIAPVVTVGTERPVGAVVGMAARVHPLGSRAPRAAGPTMRAA